MKLTGYRGCFLQTPGLIMNVLIAVNNGLER